MSEFFHVLARGSMVRWRGEIWVLHRISRAEAIFREATCGVELRLGRRRLIEELRMNTLQLVESQHARASGGPVRMGGHITAEAAIVVRVSPPWGNSADWRGRFSSPSVTPRMRDLAYAPRITHQVKRVIDRPSPLIDQSSLN